METMEFWISEKYKGAYPEPIPASLALPQWLKDDPNHLEGHVGDGPGSSLMPTYKRCVPFMDLMRTGFIIPLWRDIAFSHNDGCVEEFKHYDSSIGMECNGEASYLIEVPKYRGGAGGVETRNWESWGSIPELSDSVQGGAFTFDSPWIIRTPPGYSTLITAPFNDTSRPHPSIKTFSAIVNTDTYSNPITYFFHLKEGFNEILKKGTHLVQVIPIKREEWNHKIVYTKDGDDNDIVIQQENFFMGSTYENAYREKHGCPVRFT